MVNLTRRHFLAAATVLGAGSASAFAQDETPWAGESIIDCHHHLRLLPEENDAHVLGAGMTSALPIGLMVGAPIADPAHLKEVMAILQARSSARFPAWLCSVDPGTSDAVDQLRAARSGGACGFGEIKARFAADGPELRRIYALAGELGVPVLMHFDGQFETGFDHFEAVLKDFPATRFVAHANAFWGNMDANYDGSPYPQGKITPGGLSDRLLSDYGNFYGDLSAFSGYNGLTRDPDFTPAFIERHQDKLIFGSDCMCRDGRGAGGRDGSCQARLTLGMLKRNSTTASFGKMVWHNAHRVYGLAPGTTSRTG